MTSDERLWTAIRLERPDRVPVIPTLLSEPAAGLAGVSMAEVAADSAAAVGAAFRVFDEYGGWENPYPAAATPLQLQAAGVYPMRIRVPGRDLPDAECFQLEEAEVLAAADYEAIIAMGFEEFYRRHYLSRISDYGAERAPALVAELAAGFELFAAECAARDTQPFFSVGVLHPFFSLSLMRSLHCFARDLYQAPEPVERALRRMTDDLIASCLEAARRSGSKIVALAEERACGFFCPPAVFERFWWPYTQEIVEAFQGEGIVTLFHLDQCWNKNIEYFKGLPRGSAILQLDGATDIFAAKQALGGHLCLHGDVPAALLSAAPVEEVELYCKRLLDNVAGDGGFILGSGCSVPADARPENFRAMIESAKRHRPPGAAASLRQGIKGWIGRFSKN